MPAPAQTVPAQPSTADIANPDVQALLATLDLPQVIAVMHEEGIAYGEKLEDDLFPFAGSRRISGRSSGPRGLSAVRCGARGGSARGGGQCADSRPAGQPARAR